MNNFITIEENCSAEITEKKSKFIANIYYVESVQEAEKIIKECKKKYFDARHNCVAYRIVENDTIVERSSDDGEPSGTAGKPILEVLKKNNLNYIVCFVIRYFGGIKLGSGGLIRAYSNSTSLCLAKTKITPLQKLLKIKLTITFQENKLISKLLNKQNILDITYNENITYILLIDNTLKEKLDNYNLNYLVLEKDIF